MRIVHLALRLGLLAAVVVLLWWVFRPARDFTIVINKDGIRIRGRLPEVVRGRLISLLEDGLDLPPGVRISGRFRPGGLVALRFRGPIPPGDRQRIRNLLATI
ncbi:MAG: hypothetical protein ACYTG0_22290 [Planctomycetota bacterium]|jgi:hypothetical protein